jgi:putative acetyltransferase
MSAVHIRPETPADAAAIRAIHLAAFADHPFSQQTEHLIVDALRADGALTLSLVAEIEGDVVGHIAFSPATVGTVTTGWDGAGPVGVLPSRQRQGIGSALVEAGLAELRARGAAGCVLVGDPAFYGRFGFRHDPRITMHDVPPEVVLCLPLAGEVPAGEVVHHPAFLAGLADR